MKNILLNRLVGTALLLALAPAAYADEMNSTLYLESKEEIKLFLPAVLKNGDRALAPNLTLPEDAILAIDIRDMNSALTVSKDSPERVNYPYVNAINETEIQRNGKGWVCGLRIVDVVDEDMRETTDVDRADFCLSLEDMKSLEAMETNAEAVRQSYDLYSEQTDLSMMNALAEHLADKEKYRQDHGVLERVAAGPSLISPIKDCGKGCLVATSEFGNRMHPVLKKKRLHKGMDLRAKIGTPVVSVLNGKILANRTERATVKGKNGKKSSVIKGYGHYVIVIHPDNKLETLYAHLSGFKKKAGDTVKQGDLIALSGNTGIGTAPHLHFETHTANKKGYTPINPRTLIGTLLGSVAWIVDFFSLNA